MNQQTVKPQTANSIKTHRVLIAPLNWGLGHATRCIPIIQEFLQQGVDVIIAADGHPLALLKQEFPQLTFIELAGYNISYPASGSMAMAMLRQLSKIIRRIGVEHVKLQEIIDKYGITVVISDNRYGMWTPKVPCVFITHQVMIKCPSALRFMEPILYYINKSFIKRYTYCWIPDMEGNENLSGDLSHKYSLPKNASFIGPLSRFSTMKTENIEETYDVMAIVSGPEPQRGIFEKLLLKQLNELPQKSLLVRGVPGTETKTQSGNVTIVSHLNAQQMLNYIHASKTVVSRTGYSTLMDLVVLGKPAILVPTPGQTEQEYLATHLSNNRSFTIANQHTFDLKKILPHINLSSQKQQGNNISRYKNLIIKLLQGA